MKSSRSQYRPGERFESEIERIVPGGSGLCRGPHGVVLVPFAAPGDLALVEIETVRKGVAQGRIVELERPSSGRATPRCHLFGLCGGCDFQHLSEQAQLATKVQIVDDALRRIGGFPELPPINTHPAPRAFGSRARIELHADREHGRLGFFERGSQRIVDVEHCPVCRDELDEGIQFLRRSRQPLPRSIHLLAGDDIVRSAPALPPLEGSSFWHRIGSIEYLLDPGSFFQSSYDLLPDLIDLVFESAPEGNRLAWDLFCGAGLFALPLARRFRSVEGVDSDQSAVGNAIRGARQNGFDNARFSVADVLEWATRHGKLRGKPDYVVVDPPRSGLGGELSGLLASIRPGLLTYVSCEPTTLARDLRTLGDAGMQMSTIAIFDLFPQTHHVETVVTLQPASSLS